MVKKPTVTLRKVSHSHPCPVMTLLKLFWKIKYKITLLPKGFLFVCFFGLHLCVFVSVYFYVVMPLYACVCVHLCLYVCISLCVRLHVFAIFVLVCAFVCIYMWVCVDACLCVYRCVCVCMHVMWSVSTHKQPCTSLQPEPGLCCLGSCRQPMWPCGLTWGALGTWLFL
jgi:hypothetical protein